VVERDATITSKGQVTIPKAVRESLGLHAGDKVTFAEERPGVVLMRRRRKRSTFAAWRGFLKDMRGVDVDEYMKDIRGR
jgi:AbrB family looped-hinge helix DNA binding protein